MIGKDREEKNKGGRPTKFSPELGDLICSLIAEGKSLRKVCALEDFPHISTVMLWVLKGSRGEEQYIQFYEQYKESLELRTDYWAEEILDIADDDTDDEIFTEDGKRVQNSQFIARSKLRVNSRQWLMGKLKPKKYGERNTTELVGDKENPLQIDKIEIFHVKPDISTAKE